MARSGRKSKAPTVHPLLPLLLVATSATLGVSYWYKEQCVEGNWHRPLYAFCDSDILRLYTQRGFDHAAIPYVQQFNEYPPVTGSIQYLTSLATHTWAGWVHANEFVLAGCAIGTTLCLAALLGPSRRLFLWALGPPLALYAFQNWDLAAVLLTAGGLLAFARGRVGWAGALLALGFYAKIYPALFLPILGMDLLRQDGGLSRRGWRFGLGAAGTVAGVAAPFLLFARNGFLETFLFHIHRGPVLQSPWNALHHIAAALLDPSTSQPFEMPAFAGLGLLSNLLILAAVALSSWAVWRGRLPWAHACLGALAGFLLFNQVLSVQYDLWLLPFLVMVPVPTWMVVVFLVGDFWVFYALFDFWGHYPPDGNYWAIAAASLFRAAAYAILVGWTIRTLRAPPGQSARKRANSTRSGPVKTSSANPPATPEPNR